MFECNLPMPVIFCRKHFGVTKVAPPPQMKAVIIFPRSKGIPFRPGSLTFFFRFLKNVENVCFTSILISVGTASHASMKIPDRLLGFRSFLELA